MSKYKKEIVDLFGEEHLESDEEILEAKRQLKKRLRNAFGSDSEEDDQPLIDVMELSCSDIEEEEAPTNIAINRVTVQPKPEDYLAHKKALAQYQRQMAACVTRQTREKPIQLPPHIIARRTDGNIRGPLKEDTVQSEEEIFRTTERMIYGRTLQQVTEEILAKSTAQPHVDQTKSTIQPHIVQAVSVVQQQHVIPPIQTIAPSGVKRSRKEKRMEAKKKWFLKKKVKTTS